jgi:capsular exopolysaccharide synthesis family protein
MQKERGLLARKITDEYRAAVNRMKLMKDSVAAQSKEFNNIAEKSIQYNILKREVDTNRQLYEGLLQRLKEAGVSAGMKASNIRVVDQAEVPTKPTKPRVLLNLALGLVLGLGLGTGLAFFQESLDNTLKSPEDVQRYLQLPSLGVIPSALAKNGKGHGYGYGSGKKVAVATMLPAESSAKFSSELIAASTNWSLIEAYRSLRVSILLSTSDRLRTMLVTSAQPGEGKTTTVVNLGITLAQLGSRVLVIDADMRKPRVGELLRVEANGRGLSTCLTGQHSLDDSVSATLIPNVFVLPCGPVPPNPPELLSSKAMRQLLSDAKDKFDFVLLDSPPLLMVSDGRVLASQADGVILVAQGGSTSREAVNHAKAHLLQVNANVVGVTLNNLDLSASGYGKYYYQGAYSKAYGHSPDDAERQHTGKSS